MATASKTRKPRTNNFTSILDLFLEKYNLSTESSPSQLRVYASELGAMLPDWKARKSVKEALRRRLFKEDQIKALVPDKRNEKLTIKERAQYYLLKSAVHVLAMDAFGNKSALAFLKAYRGENIRVIDNKFQPLIGKTIEYLPDPNNGAEAMRIGFEFLKQGKCVAFVVTSSNMARGLVKKASKLSFKACAYYGDMDGKQRKKDFLDINTAWGELDCVAYTNTVEAGISFEKPNHFDIVIGITNIETPVNVEAFIQMMFRIRDCEKQWERHNYVVPT
ncbi:12239_t:CDS:2 [Entrophospora sp. SA101]|nr:12239_t:CDS:2 [Entrophospora sp. SA101]